MPKNLFFIAAALISFPAARAGQSVQPAQPVSSAQNDDLTDSTLPAFLARYEESLAPLDQAYEDLSNENLPLRDETGQPLGRRHIEDRRQTLASLRKTVRQLASSPQELVLTVTLLVQTEALVDDLFDLSQIAYDNDREELGKRFSDLETSMDHHSDSVEAYALKLAADKQQRIQQLEKENQELAEKVRGAAEAEKSKTNAERK